MTKFKQEQRVFDRLKSDCSPRAKQEYELAIRTLLERYNTTIYENRFVVGGAVEVFTCTLLRSVGIDCTLYGSQATAGDLLLPNDKKLSVKASFRGVQAIKLLNQMGEGDRPWTTATLFVISGVGIVFGAPDMVDPEHVKSTGDGKSLTAKGIKSLIEESANVFPMAIAKKPPTEVAGSSRRASTPLARQILSEVDADTLLATLSDDHSF